jgi:hypothetical protein
MKLNEFEKIAKILAKDHKITVLPGNGWAANLKDRKVFYRKNDIYTLAEEHILGLLLHEIAHIHYTDDIKMPDKNAEITHSTLNMVEDIAIEHIISGDYPNAGEILESTRTEVLDTLLKLLPKHKASIYEKALLFAATRFEGRGYTGKEKYEIIGEKISKIMLSRKDEILKRPKTEALMPMVKDIVDLMIKLAGEPSESDKTSMQAGLDSADGYGQEEGNKTKRKVINALRTGKGWKDGIEATEKIGFIDAIADQAQMIGKQIRSVLKRNNAMEFGGRYRSGKLIAKRFIRIIALKDRFPFARRIVKSNQSYAFAIASDVSGSMFDNIGYSNKKEEKPASYALTSMFMVGEALRIAAIPRAMILFGTKATVVSPMGKKAIRWEELANETELKKAGQSNTRIELAMEKCIEQLKEAKAERKIMIILTDGNSDLYDMLEMHKKALNAGIEPLGITIGDEGNHMQKTFGNKNRIITDCSNPNLIGKAFIDILKESIAKSK